MFSRRFTDVSKLSSNNIINVNQSEFLDAINDEETQKIKNYLNDLNLKIYQIKDENGYTPLHRSVFKNNYDLTLQIINKVKREVGLGPSNKIENFINEKTNEGYTALHYAAIVGNLKIVKLLKEYGAKIDYITKEGQNVLHLAAQSNQPSIILYFLFNDPLDISSVDETGSTPLHWACYSGAVESVLYLISLKADINALDNEQYTPLHIATISNKAKIVKLLLQNNADKNIRSQKGLLPIDIARNKNFTKIVNLLLDKEFNPYCTLEFPITYIQPDNLYKKIMLLMIIIPEIIVFILVFPFIENMYHIYASLGTFFFSILAYVIFIYKNPGYQMNYGLLNECKRLEIKNPLKKLVDDEVDIKNFCPKCYVNNSIDNNIKHCFICDKCVIELSHHCFWINKCVGKKNKCAYLFFIFSSFLYAFYSIFICCLFLFDSVYIPYEKAFPPSWLNWEIDRGFRVVGSGLVIVFSIIISFPLFFLFMFQMCKSCKLLGKDEMNNSLEISKNSEEPFINDDYNEIKKLETEENILNNNDTININISNQKYPLMEDRPSNTSNQ